MRYFFNLAGAVYDPDKEGAECFDLAEARIAAVKFGTDYLRDQPELACQNEGLRVEVTDSLGWLQFTFAATGVDAPHEPTDLAISRRASRRP